MYGPPPRRKRKVKTASKGCAYVYGLVGVFNRLRGQLTTHHFRDGVAEKHLSEKPTIRPGGMSQTLNE
jgi:hypothetical protein